MNTHLSIFSFNKSPLIRQENIFQEETVSSPIYSFAVDDLIAEKGDEASSSQALSEENQAKLKTSFPCCKGMSKMKSKMLIF
jgi:hypothetical protein